MDYDFGELVESMGVASGWKLWVWIECIVWLVGVAIRRYIDILIIIITFPYSTCISSFFGSSIPTPLFIFKMFFLSCLRIRIRIRIRRRNGHFLLRGART